VNYDGQRKRAKQDVCDAFLNICEPLHDILTIFQSPTALPFLNIVRGMQTRKDQVMSVSAATQSLPEDQRAKAISEAESRLQQMARCLLALREPCSYLPR
jgi:hypothetical protein